MPLSEWQIFALKIENKIIYLQNIFFCLTFI